jgi:Zn-dependent peptidase ImmA (M78 family)
MPKVNPDILRWARETAGLGLEAAAEKIALGNARGEDGAERLAALEAGDTSPTRPLLVRMAKQYRRPLLAFYLAEPPRKGSRGQDFRTLPQGSNAEDEALLDVLLRDIVARQSLVRAALEDEDDQRVLAWVGSVTMDAGVDRLVREITDALRFDIAVFRTARNAEESFRLLRESVEALGAFVVLASNLGSHHTSLGTDVFRGIAVADPVAPFVVINDQDSRTAWSFTLLHEVAHLWLGATGVSGGPFDREIERFCNQVASEILLPARELRELSIPVGVTATQLEELISDFAESRRVSRSMLAYRLYVREAITEQQWRAATKSFHTQWIAVRDLKRARNEGATGGPDYYVVRRHHLGGALLGTAMRLLAAGAITTVKAGQILGVKPNNVQQLMEGARSRVRRSG